MRALREQRERKSRRFLLRGISRQRAYLALTCLGLAVLVSPSARGASEGEVSLPLPQYLALKAQVEAAESLAQEAREEARLEVVAHRTVARIEEGRAAVRTVFEVEARGAGWEALEVPFGGLAASIEVEPVEGLSVHGAGVGSLDLVAQREGSYRVTVEGWQALEEDGAGSWLELPPALAPVEEVSLDLAAGAAWEAPGAVVVSEALEGERRKLRLSFPWTSSRRVGVRGRALEEAPEEVLAQLSVVTVVDLGGPVGRRLDLVFYEVLRGGVDRFVVQLPPGVHPRRLSTDEGEVPPPVGGERLEVVRSRRLEGVGYLALSTPLDAEASSSLSLAPVIPTLPVRSRYLVLASDRALGATPQPETAWSRVDLGDLPAILATELPPLHPGAAWRLAAGEGEEPLRLALEPLPVVAVTPERIRRRETTTVLSREGSLVHQDLFLLEGVSSALRLTLPPGATLWSASVDGTEVRPVTRGGELFLPLGFRRQGASKVRLVTLEKRSLERGRGEVGMRPAKVGLPVLEHRWRVLVPETHRFRIAEGSLPLVTQGGLSGEKIDPLADRDSFFVAEEVRAGSRAGVRGVVIAPDGSPLPGVAVSLRPEGRFTEVVKIAFTDAAGVFDLREVPPGSYELVAELEGFPGIGFGVRLRPGMGAVVRVPMQGAVQEETIVVSEITSRTATELDRAAAQGLRDATLRKEMAQLRQGLVGGVKPLPVEVPESGKLLFLAGVLPAEEVALTLETRSR